MRFGPFWLDSRLAVGGTAEVYLAHPAEASPMPRRLVVKRMLPSFISDPEGRTMFEREAALHASVHHPNVVTIYGSGVAPDGEPWLAMEYVEGADTYRLLRRCTQQTMRVPATVAVHIARQVLGALASVHGAKDSAGHPLGIIHRDVTPSNIYLSLDGTVKLGDFGIARSLGRATMRNAASAMLKGKFAYMAPEQVAGEPYDSRADLFSTAVVLAEILLGKPLFAGSGQLAVLLAIRDCRIDALKDGRANMPKGMFEVLEKALSRDPNHRYQTAEAFAKELAQFDANPAATKSELAALVKWVHAAPSTDAMAAVHADVLAPTAPPPPMLDPSDLGDDEDTDAERKTGEYSTIPSYVLTSTKRRLGPWSFARLVEAVATGEIGRGDQVDYMGRGMTPIADVEDLVRFLPPPTMPTSKINGPGAPDFADDLSAASLLTILLRIAEQGATGVLFAEGPSDPNSRTSEPGRKEIYFVGGKLHHVASSNAGELLGVYLVRRGVISQTELDFVLAVLPRYHGRIGDTLVSLGLATAVSVFRHIRDQGRDRVLDLFSWKQGRILFYVGQETPHVEFPLAMDLPPLMQGGLEIAQPGDTPSTMFKGYMDARLGPASPAKPTLRALGWPLVLQRVLDLTATPRPLREVISLATHRGDLGPNDVVRAVEILLAAKLIAWAPA